MPLFGVDRINEKVILHIDFFSFKPSSEVCREKIPMNNFRYMDLYLINKFRKWQKVNEINFLDL